MISKLFKIIYKIINFNYRNECDTKNTIKLVIVFLYIVDIYLIKYILELEIYAQPRLKF